MKKNIAILFSILLVSTTQSFANRPGLEDSSPEDRFSTSDTQTSAPVQTTMTQPSGGDMLEISKDETISIKPLDFPRRGMTMKQVLSELGNPRQTIPAVGKPPIRKWVYDDRTIYFEEMTVIHVVKTP